MKSLSSSVAALAALVLLLAIAPRSEAQQVQGSLSTLVNSPQYAAYFGPVDRLMATALDAASVDLSAFCPDGCSPAFLNSLDGQLNDLSSAANNVLFGQLPPDIAAEQVRVIASALRSIAPEEWSAQRLASNEFASDQRDQIRSRLEALRKGGQGFAVNGFVPKGPNDVVARRAPALIGAASADALPTDFSRLGGFLNGTYTSGERDPSDLEAAFKTTGSDVALGVDYRLSYHAVLGAMVSYTSRTLDFESTQSASTGTIDSSGLAAVLYASYEWDGPYLSASIGQQKLANDMQRLVRYGLESVITPIDALNTASTDSTATTITLDGGWLLQQGAFGYEPLLRMLYRDTTFDAFTESSVGASGPTGLGFTIAERSTTTLNGSLGMKLTYAFTPSFGVLVPYLQGEYRREFKTEPMQVRANFADIVSAGVTSPTSTLTLDSDRPDESYYSVEAGASAVFKHGIQGFLNARSLFGLADAKLYVISLGIRGEF
jgi:outer membrane autotransporter protein